jgi:C4-dicarboxylate-specific signal transduction histidine kinase
VTTRSGVLVALLLLATAIFAIDLALPLGVASGVPYVAVVLLALWSPDPRLPLQAAGVCSALTLLGFALSPNGGELWVVAVNRSLALLAIWVTALLCVRWRRAERRMSQQQEQLERVLRVNTMGEMASGIAHELNQPLSTILNHSDASILSLKAGRVDSDLLLQDFDAISNAAERAGEIIHRLRELISHRTLTRRSTSLNRLIRESVEFMGVDLERAGLVLHLELRPALPPVQVDPVQIQQVVVNLVRNAAEAMAETEDKSLTIRTDVDDAGRVEVSFSDTGCGLGDLPADSIFEHFVSSKRDGLGVGLAISRSIIEAHQGHLEVAPNAARGATFRFAVPASDVRRTGEEERGDT